MNENAAYRRVVHAVAVFAAPFTLPLLYVGGTVTTYRVGMAVPDWPTTFQENMFLYNFWNARFRVRVEHTHRLYAAAVGVGTIVLAVCLLAFEPRRWLKVLGPLTVVAVVAQGRLGGLRVQWNSTLMAAVHGGTGQAFFGLLVALCVFTGRDWTTAAKPSADRDGMRVRSAIALGLVYAQIAVGGWLRHYGTPTAFYLHSTLAAAVGVYSAWLAWRITVRRADVPRLVVPSRILVAAVCAQIVLGLAALALLWPLDGTARPVPSLQAMVRTGHQTNAAILFAASIVLTLRSCRHLAGAADDAATRAAERPVGRPEPASLDWEAVA